MNTIAKAPPGQANPQTKKNIKRTALSITLIISVLIAGAFAFLTATDTKTNIFTIGHVDVELKEIVQGETYDKSTGDPDPIENILPGLEIDKEPFVKNTGANDAYIFMTVGIPTAPMSDIGKDADGNVVIADNNTTICIPVQTYAIQTGYDNLEDNAAPITVWNSFINENTVFEGTGNGSGEVELFEVFYNNIKGFNTTNWTMLDAQTHKVDGMTYYVFSYNGTDGNNRLNPQQETEKIFTTVILSGLIGEKGNNTDIPSTPDSQALLTLSAGDILPENYSYISANGNTFTNGDAIPSELQTGDIVRDGNYEYCYNATAYDLQMQEWSYNDSVNGWSVRLINHTMTTIIQPLLEVQNKPVYNIGGCYAYQDTITELTGDILIPSNRLGNKSIYFNDNLTTAVVNDNVTVIEEDVFDICSKLTTLTLPNNLTSIGMNSICNCPNLTTVIYKGISYSNGTDLRNALIANGVTVDSGAILYNTLFQ